MGRAAPEPYDAQRVATEAGERLLARLRPALHDLDLALGEVDAFRGAPSGVVRINAPEAAARLLLERVVPVLLERHPAVHVDLVTEGRLVDIVAEGFDAGVRLGESVPQDMIAVRFGAAARFLVGASPPTSLGRAHRRRPTILQPTAASVTACPAAGCTAGSSSATGRSWRWTCPARSPWTTCS